jgi:hypothetical protein
MLTVNSTARTDGPKLQIHKRAEYGQKLKNYSMKIVDTLRTILDLVLMCKSYMWVLKSHALAKFWQMKRTLLFVFCAPHRTTDPGPSADSMTIRHNLLGDVGYPYGIIPTKLYVLQHYMKPSCSVLRDLRFLQYSVLQKSIGIIHSKPNREKLNSNCRGFISSLTPDIFRY